MSIWKAAELTERSALSLVEVYVVALSDDDNVPRIDTPGCGHKHRQDSIGGIYVGLVLLGKLECKHKVLKSVFCSWLWSVLDCSPSG